MKCVIILCALVFLAAGELYEPTNDHIDIEAVIGDHAVLKEFLNCFNDIGSCNEQMADFKSNIPEAVVQGCAKCTDAQKHIFKRFLEVVKVEKPEDYQVFKQKYDPQDKYLTALETAIANS